MLSLFLKLKLWMISDMILYFRVDSAGFGEEREREVLSAVHCVSRWAIGCLLWCFWKLYGNQGRVRSEKRHFHPCFVYWLFTVSVFDGIVLLLQVEPCEMCESRYCVGQCSHRRQWTHLFYSVVGPPNTHKFCFKILVFLYGWSSKHLNRCHVNVLFAEYLSLYYDPLIFSVLMWAELIESFEQISLIGQVAVIVCWII